VPSADPGAITPHPHHQDAFSMRIPRQLLGALVALGASLVSAADLAAQGVTTGAITGTVADASGAGIEGAQIQIINVASGTSTGGLTRRNGLYLVQGLEVGGPYTVRVRRIGFEPVERTGIFVSLSAATRVDIALAAQATVLAGVTIEAEAEAGEFSPTRQGVGTTIGDTLIRRMPLLNRNFTDLVKLTPQVINPGSGGSSAGGQYNRFNSFNIDGASQNDRFNLNSSGGQPGAAGNGRIISAEAVKEFRVLLSPTDVRQANFTGMLVNAVTKSGTNTFEGGATYTFRNENFSSSNFRTTKLDVKQYGFQLGGPIIKDKLHFFVAPEWQERTSGATGAFVGAGGTTTGANLNIAPDSIALVQQLVRDRLGFEPGTSGRIDLDNPLTNLFGRLDWSINEQHRLVFRQLVNRTENLSFSRNSNTFNTSPTTQNTGFRLGSNQFNGVNKNNSSVAQLYSNFLNGMANEFIAGFNTIRDERIVPTVTPEVAVGVVPVGATGTGTTNPTAVITFGTEQFSIGNRAEQDILELQNNFTMPFGVHTVTVGGRFEHVKVFNQFPQALGGVYVFPNIAALDAVTPSGYAVGYPNSGNPADIPAEFTTNMTSLYAQDQWSLSQNLTLTAGLRADIPVLDIKPVRNETAMDLFAAAGLDLDNSATPKTRAYWSPRLGFNWDPTGDQMNQVRGNIGVFTGPPPFVLVGNPEQNSGANLVLLSCTGAATPAFTADVNNLPRACLTGDPPAPGTPPAPNQAGTNTLNLNDPDLKYPQSFVTSLGFDRQLPFGFVATVEGLYRKAINGLRVRDINLLGPRLVNGEIYRDRNGRVLYADTILANGTITNFGARAIDTLRGVPFTQGAIYLTNESKSYNYTLTGQLKKRFADLEVTGAYTFNRARDVQSLTSDRAISNWRFSREYAGLESADDLTTSAFERPHRVILYGTYTLPWKRFGATDVTMFYEGVSGNPVTYTSTLDLNGDGFNGNDPIYVPRDATDQSEILIGSMTTAGVFTQDTEAAADFDEFIESQECLDKQRGRIMARNSCRTPWQNRMDLSIRQSIPEIAGQNFTVQLDVINFPGALGEALDAIGTDKDRNWFKVRGATLSSNPQQAVLAGNSGTGLRARSIGTLAESQPVYTFNSTARTRGPYDFESNLGYNMQLTFRYAF
jgi:hypothetical protein